MAIFHSDFRTVFCGGIVGIPALTFTGFRAVVAHVVARANYRLDWGVLWGRPDFGRRSLLIASND